MNKAVFLDRDGTLVFNKHYARSPEQMELTPGAAEAVAEFRRRGYLVVLITNQSGVARGYFSMSDRDAVNDRTRALFAPAASKLDAIYICPHLPADHPDCAEPCDCRKPKPGLLLQAARDLDIDLSRSIMIGDAPSDVEAGRAAGCRTVLLAAEPEADPDRADFVARTLPDILPWLDAES